MSTSTRLRARAISAAVLAALACLLLPAPPARAQTETTGAIEGRVVDEQGNGIPGVTVQFTNQETQVPTATRTNAEGYFIKFSLQPGTYSITIRTPQGFQPPERRPQRVFLTEKRETLPPIRLQRDTIAAAPTPAPTAAPGGGTPPAPATPAATTVTATTQATDDAGDGESIPGAINRTDGRRGGGYTEKDVSTLPLGATTLTRTFDELALLLPGVAPPPQTLGDVAGPGVGSGVGSAGQFSVNGLRSRGNNFTVDGSDNNDEDIGVRRQGFFSLVPQPVESVREYRVTTLLAPAQYGRNFGAQVDAVSKSGGNETHGTLFGFFNSSRLNAPNFFDTTGGNTTTALQGRSTPGGQLRDVYVDNRRLTVTNSAGRENSFTLGQGGLVIGGPLIPSDPDRPERHTLFYFFSAEGQLLNASKEVNFAVPTVEQRGAFGTGASGISIHPLDGTPVVDFPTTVPGDAIFSFFPFANNPGGVYGANTFTQTLPASAQGKILSGKASGNFNAFGRRHEFAARYNFTQDWRDIPAVGGALFARLRPNVRTQNFATFFNTELSDTASNQLRLSYGRTRLVFEEGRDTEFLLPTRRTFADPDDGRFLLNTRFLLNLTLPGLCSVPGVTPPCASYQTVGETETSILGFFNPDPSGFSFLGGSGGVTRLGPIGQINIAGFSPVGVDVFNFPQRRVNNTYQLADTVALRVGNHGVTFGTDLRRAELISDLPRNARPLITFNGAPRITCANSTCSAIDFAPNVAGAPSPFILPQDFAAAGAPSGFFQSLVLPGRDSHINLRYYQLYFFGQDEWRLRPNLSLSFGLRYEYTTPPREAERRIESTFSATLPTLVSGLGNFIDGRTRIFEPDRNNFAPRVGIAYSPELFGPDRTSVIRAGYGIFYDQVLGAVVSQSRNVFPTFTTVNFGGGCCDLFAGDPDPNVQDEGFNIFNPLQATLLGVPLIQPGTLNTINPALLTPPLSQSTLLGEIFFNFPTLGSGQPFGATYPSRVLKTPTAHHYSLTFEQQLSRNMVISAAYVGTQGRHLLRFTTPNLGANYLVVPLSFDANEGSSGGPTFSGFTVDPGTFGPNATIRPTVGRPLTTIGPINLFESSANSRYDALQVQLRGRYARGLQYQANYTLSRADDDASDVFDLAGASALPQNSLTREGERAPSNFDARHRFSYNVNFAFPTFAGRGRALRAVFGGLEIASTGQFQTGQPFTVNSLFDINLDGNLTDRLDNAQGLIFTGDRRQPLRRPTDDPNALARAFLAPVGQDGSVPRNSFRASNLMLFNVAVIKNFRITENQALTFRAEIFNLTDRDNFGIPVRYLEAPGFGQATETVTPGRRVQFALKYSF